MVESTNLIGPTGFKEIKTFLKEIVNAFDIRDSGTRVSLIAFNNRPRINLRFDSLRRGSLTKKNVKERIDQMEYNAASTASIYEGLEVAEQMVFGSWGNAREYVNKVRRFTY